MFVVLTQPLLREVVEAVVVLFVCFQIVPSGASWYIKQCANHAPPYPSSSNSSINLNLTSICSPFAPLTLSQTNTPPSFFGLTLEGQFQCPQNTSIIDLNCDDSCWLLVDNYTVHKDWIVKGAGPRLGIPTNLSAGIHTFKLNYFQDQSTRRLFFQVPNCTFRCPFSKGFYQINNPFNYLSNDLSKATQNTLSRLSIDCVLTTVYVIDGTIGAFHLEGMQTYRYLLTSLKGELWIDGQLINNTLGIDPSPNISLSFKLAPGDVRTIQIKHLSPYLYPGKLELLREINGQFVNPTPAVTFLTLLNSTLTDTPAAILSGNLNQKQLSLSNSTLLTTGNITLHTLQVDLSSQFISIGCISVDEISISGGGGGGSFPFDSTASQVLLASQCLLGIPRVVYCADPTVNISGRYNGSYLVAFITPPSPSPEQSKVDLQNISLIALGSIVGVVLLVVVVVFAVPKCRRNVLPFYKRQYQQRTKRSVLNY